MQDVTSFKQKWKVNFEIGQIPHDHQLKVISCLICEVHGLLTDVITMVDFWGMEQHTANNR